MLPFYLTFESIAATSINLESVLNLVGSKTDSVVVIGRVDARLCTRTFLNSAVHSTTPPLN